MFYMLRAFVSFLSSVSVYSLILSISARFTPEPDNITFHSIYYSFHHTTMMLIGAVLVVVYPPKRNLTFIAFQHLCIMSVL